MDEAAKAKVRTLGGMLIDAGIGLAADRAAKKAAAAPGKSGQPSLTPRQIFGYSAGAKLTTDLVKKRYRELAAVYHPDPDTTRDDSTMLTMLGRVREQLLKEITK